MFLTFILNKINLEGKSLADELITIIIITVVQFWLQQCITFYFTLLLISYFGVYGTFCVILAGCYCH